MGADNQAERVLDRIARLEAAEAEIARLRAQSDSSDRVIQVQHDEIERLRAYANHERSLGAEGPMIELTSAKQEIERLRGENADLRRWKALDKPLTAAMAIANSHTRHDKSLIADLLLEKRLVNAEIERLRLLLARCRTILNNMAWENEGAIFNRWPIAAEPLRADAKSLLPIVDEELRLCPITELPTSDAS